MLRKFEKKGNEKIMSDGKRLRMNAVTPLQSHYLANRGIGLLCFILCGFDAHQAQSQVGSGVRQIIVAQSADWDSSTAILQCYSRNSDRESWQPLFNKSIPVLLGRAGLAWGRGVFTPQNNGQPMKVEKDWKAPAGIFRLGQLYGYAAAPPNGASWPYVQVGPYDAWVDDSKSPFYNQHIRVDPMNIPPWFEKQKMRLGDAAYKWLLAIQHNAPPAAPGYGSAIFFHVRRGPTKPSAGCTTMAVENLEAIIRWLDPGASPHYVLLPKADYAALRDPWRLP